MHICPCPATSAQVVRPAVQIDSQQGWPLAPQVPHAPETHTKPVAQSCPSDTQVPGSSGPAREQQPPPQPLRGQQRWPGAPHVMHIEPGPGPVMAALIMTHTRSAVAQGDCPRMISVPDGQQGPPACPQPVQRPSAQTP
jgi:hypothetical protein